LVAGSSLFGDRVDFNRAFLDLSDDANPKNT